MLLRAPYALFALAGAVILIVPVAADAQTFAQSVPFTMSISPEYPQPNASATLSLASGSVDLTNATISVSVNGKAAYEGNARPVSIATGATGKTLNVSVSVTSHGATYRKSLSFTPQDVSIVAEPQSSVPPLYQGGALVPLAGSTRIVAMADLRTNSGTALDPSALSYVWTVDGQRDDAASGVGKNAIIVASPLQYRSRSVSVTVRSPGESLIGGDALSLSAQEPFVRIYRYDPLLGIRFDEALGGGSYDLQNAELTLYGAPFAFPTSGGAPDMQWFLNGSAAQSGPLVTLRPQGSGTGTARLSFTASSGNLNKASASLSISFGSAGSSNLFGL